MRCNAESRSWNRAGLAGLMGLGVLLVASPAHAAPQYLRLSYTGDTTTTMTVSWNTTAPTSTSEVQYGTSSGLYTDTAVGSSFQANAGLGYIHESTLTGLLPLTTYYYVAGDVTDGFSTERTFTTGPVQDANCGDFSFVVLGDNRPDPTFGGGENWPQILAEAAQHSPAFAINGGDLVIDGDQIDEWIDFLGWTEGVASVIPFMACIGNHDDGPGEGATANYNQIFAYPTSQGTYGSGTEDYYYFTYGNAIFVSLSTETFKGGGSTMADQAQWLDEVLTQNPRKWKFLYYHKPSYTHEVFFSISHEPNEEGQNAALMPVIDAHHVDVVFTSHNHWYERWEPSACGTAGTPGSDDPCTVSDYSSGTVFIVTGGAGAFTIPGFLCGNASGRANCSGDHHYVRVSISDHELSLETWAAYPQTNQVFDSIAITKTADNCAVGPGPDAGVDASVPSDGSVGPDASGPGPDSGSGDPDAASGTDGGGPGVDAGEPVGTPKDGCACRSAGPGAGGPLVLALLLGLLWIRRRR